MHFENHFTASAQDPLAKRALPWSLPFSIPSLLATILMSGWSSGFAEFVSTFPGDGGLPTGDDDLPAGAWSDSESLASTICIRFQPPEDCSVAPVGDALPAGDGGFAAGDGGLPAGGGFAAVASSDSES